MFNNIIYSHKNKYPGKLFNSPPVGLHDVYQNMTVNFSGKSFTKLALLQSFHGNFDVVFIFWSGHGLPGKLLLPNGTISSDELLSTLRLMRFNKLLFVVSACFSASMFEGKTLPPSMIAVASSKSFGVENYCRNWWENQVFCLAGTLLWMDKIDNTVAEVFSGAHFYGDVSLLNNSVRHFLQP